MLMTKWKILNEHQEFMENKILKPKLKKYETKVNEYQEKELFTGLTEKQVKMTKLLLNSEYKDFDKQIALNKIKEEYREIFNNTENNKEKEVIFNPKTLIDLNNNTINNKAESIGVKNEQEMISLLETLF